MRTGMLLCSVAVLASLDVRPARRRMKNVMPGRCVRLVLRTTRTEGPIAFFASDFSESEISVLEAEDEAGEEDSACMVATEKG